jgi:TolB-like protein/DNA-binding winged helix-turn-helix (wHTH) protein/tetratricopeptide (TPR) repeat protein
VIDNALNEEETASPSIDNHKGQCYAPSENALCMTTKPVNEYKFGPYHANTRDLELRKSGIRIRLQPKPFQVLKVLLERAGQSVSREELKTLLWAPNIFVDFDHGLNTAVNKIRESLSDSAEEPRYIETLANGYKFIGDISEQSERPFVATAPLAASPQAASPLSTHPDPRGEVTWRKRYLAPAVALTCLIAVVFLVLHTAPKVFGTSSATIQSVAVLPLKNLSGDPSQEYFSDSMTDELITQLAKISSLNVPSAGSVVHYKNRSASASEIRRDLKVDAFLEGSVLRTGDKIRVTAQLIDARTDRHIWAEDYQGDLRDVLVLQNDIATAIAHSVKAKVAPADSLMVSVPRQVEPRAYDAYIRGRGYWVRSNTANGGVPGDVERSGELFQEAIRYDPNFARAYSGLADYYGVKAAYGAIPAEDGWRKSEEASRKALALDDRLAEAHCSLASKMMFYDWNWTGAEREIQRGLELDTHYAVLHNLYSHLLSYTGRFDQSIVEARRAEELDPLGERFAVQRALRFSRRFDAFLIEVDKAFAQDLARIHKERAAVYKAKKQHVEEVHETDQELRIEGCVPCADRLATAYAQRGYSGWLRERLDGLNEISKDGNARPFEHAELYAAMGNTDMVMHYLELGYREHTVELVSLQVNPAYDGMRTDPRFKDLVHRIGLPEN